MRDVQDAETTLDVGFVGAGSIGATLARGYDALGHDVVINDADPDRAAEVEFPAVSKDKIREDCDLAIVAVPTPTTDTGGDASIVKTVVGEVSGGQATICLRSTMPPGETRDIANEHDEPVVYTPEFLRDRSTVKDFFDPDRIVIAGPPEQRQLVRESLDSPSVDCGTIIESRDYLSVEIGKEAHNAFFATKVSFANQMRLICERVDADPGVVMDIITADSRNTSSHLDPMLGPYGGKCLPKDTEALTLFGQFHGASTPLLAGTIETNNLAREKYENVEIQGTFPDISVSQ